MLLMFHIICSLCLQIPLSMSTMNLISKPQLLYCVVLYMFEKLQDLLNAYIQWTLVNMNTFNLDFKKLV